MAQVVVVATNGWVFIGEPDEPSTPGVYALKNAGVLRVWGDHSRTRANLPERHHEKHDHRPGRHAGDYSGCRRTGDTAQRCGRNPMGVIKRLGHGRGSGDGSGIGSGGYTIRPDAPNGQWRVDHPSHTGLAPLYFPDEHTARIYVAVQTGQVDNNLAA